MVDQQEAGASGPNSSHAEAFALAGLVAGWLAQGAVSHIGAAILAQQLNDLGFTQSPEDVISESIQKSVQVMIQAIQEAFLNDNLQDAQADAKDACLQLKLYNASPMTSMDRLESATAIANNASAHLEAIGWKAYWGYHNSIGIQLNIQEERIKRLGASEKQATVVLIDHALENIRKWRREWKKDVRDAVVIVPIPHVMGGNGPFGSVPNVDLNFGISTRPSEVYESHHDAIKRQQEVIEEDLATLRADVFEKSSICVEKWKALSEEYE